MNIGILTQPLINNYGGILQNYALQTILKREGFKVYTIDRRHPPVSKMKIILSIIKRGLAKYILRKDIVFRLVPTKREAKMISYSFVRFIKENITQTEEFHTNNFDFLKKYGFNAYIVGSDQVWRPRYSPCLTNYFFDFLDGNNEVKKIAYAASFGVDNWELTEEETKQCSALAKQFNSISVRENSAVELCGKYFNVKAIHVFDPTILLKKEDYCDLIKQDNIPEREDILFCYLLDNSDKKSNFVNKAAKTFQLHPVFGMPANSFHLKKSKKDISDCIFISISEWIAGFRDAKFVITDSFHGTVFSILFNKPFVVFVNEKRGNARLNSLLQMFNLEERLITSSDLDNGFRYLDYSEINKIIEKGRDKSITYLLECLK